MDGYPIKAARLNAKLRLLVVVEPVGADLMFSNAFLLRIVQFTFIFLCLLAVRLCDCQRSAEVDLTIRPTFNLDVKCRDSTYLILHLGPGAGAGRSRMRGDFFGFGWESVGGGTEFFSHYWLPNAGMLGLIWFLGRRATRLERLLPAERCRGCGYELAFRTRAARHLVTLELPPGEAPVFIGIKPTVRRRLWHVMVISLLLAVVTAGLWGAHYGVGLRVDLDSTNRWQIVGDENLFRAYSVMWVSEYHPFSLQHPVQGRDSLLGTGWNSVDRFGDDPPYTRFFVSYWLVICSSLAIFQYARRTRRRLNSLLMDTCPSCGRHHPREGLIRTTVSQECPVCHYNLCSHKPGQKCPECGTQIPRFGWRSRLPT